MEAELKYLKNSQPIHISKNENIENVAKQLLDKMSLDQPSQQKSGTIIQNNGRMTLKAIQRSLGLTLHHRSICMGLGRGDGCPLGPPAKPCVQDPSQKSYRGLAESWYEATLPNYGMTLSLLGVEYGVKEEYSWALKSHELCLARFWTCLEPITFFFFPYSPFWYVSA